MHGYINTLGNEIITQTLIDPVDLKTILKNIQAAIPLYLHLPSDPNTDIWPFTNSLRCTHFYLMTHWLTH